MKKNSPILEKLLNGVTFVQPNICFMVPEGEPAGEGGADEGGPPAGGDEGGSDDGAPAGGGDEGNPNDWSALRKSIAGDNETNLKKLERIPDVATLAKSWLSADEKIRSGELVSAEAPKDEKALAAYREKRGIPVDSEKYFESIKFEEGVVVGDADKAMLQAASEVALEHNVPPATIQAIAEKIFGQRDADAEEIYANDEKMLEELDDTLRNDWGGDYKRHRQMTAGIVEKLGIAEQLSEARLSDGTLLALNPTVQKLLLQAAYADPTLVHEQAVAGQLENVEDIDAAIQEIRGRLRSDDEQVRKSVTEADMDKLAALDAMKKKMK